MSFDSLVDPLNAVGDQFGIMRGQMEQLNEVNDSLIRFNDAFGAFLFGMQATAASHEWPDAPRKSSFKLFDRPAVKTASAPNPATSTPRAGRHGDSSAPQKKPSSARRFLVKINPRVIIDHLPLKYREQTEAMRNMEKVIKRLGTDPDGVTLPNLAKEIGLPKHRVTDCLNTLVHRKVVVKQSQSNQPALYRLEPTRFPSR
ncbi:hypothetical protein BX666DRAFT_1904829 [Dichotomocladium elegans]|nr:hypothetical protein BX666DRAFT_1904829 [Dichotomocladium elegans]